MVYKNAVMGDFKSISDGPPREKICGSVPTKGTLCEMYK
jgi:hypothetical protein